MKNNLEFIELDGKYAKIRHPEELGKSPAVLMLHGLTGDESSMWVFANLIAPDSLIIAPRAPFPAIGSGLSGFSWVDLPGEAWPTFQDFFTSAHWLDSFLENLTPTFPAITSFPLKIFGFSQGGAMAFAYSMIHSPKVSQVGLLSSFLPDDSDGFLAQAESDNVPKFFIGHGENDSIVPVELARNAHHTLTGHGYSVQMCVTDVGHRLGSDCFSAFRIFMEAE